MPPWAKVLAGVGVACAAWAIFAWSAWQGAGGCMLVSRVVSTTGKSEAEVSVCGTRADSLETTIWFGDAQAKVRALHATTPVDEHLFDQGPPALTMRIAQDFPLTWLDESHLEVSLPDGRTWVRDEDSYRGVTVTYKQRPVDSSR